MPRRVTLTNVLDKAFTQSGIPFVFIIDEWDCVFRKNKIDTDSQTLYLDFLRNLLKDQSYVALAYMTGILPIKKYGEHSAINVFYEYSMTNAKPISEFTGFTEDEVKAICKEYSKADRLVCFLCDSILIILDKVFINSKRQVGSSVQIS